MPKRTSRPLMFQTDLNGRERVDRRFARKAWAWGFPVWQDAGRGAMLLPPPVQIPVPAAMEAFDRVCWKALPRSVKSSEPEWRSGLRSRCVYLVHFDPSALHLLFADGSNPFVKYGSIKELQIELEAWSRRYGIRRLNSDCENVINYKLTEKTRDMPELFAPGP